MIERQNEDGSWNETDPVEFQGWKANLEQNLYRWRLPCLARVVGRWDERNLGK